MQGQAWEVAHEAARRTGVVIRALTELEDADRILEVMTATWGEHQLLPRELIRAFQASGNVPLGAFGGDELVGYVLGFLGAGPGGVHLHSHMLAVVPGRRHAGVGYALKLAQRAQTLDAGVGVARWTFDPLQARNAYFNLSKLGAVGDRFHRHFYGEMTDLLNRGDRSDRLVIRWDLERAPRPWPFPPGEHRRLLWWEGDADAPRPVRRRDPDPFEDGVAAAEVFVPPDYARLKDEQPALAIRWRDAVAEAFEECFGRGRIAVQFHRDESAYDFALPEDVVDWPAP